MTSVEIRPARAEDRAGWLPLWQGYLDFYQQTLPEAQTDLTFARALDPAESLHLVIAARNGQCLGFAAYVLHRSTWAATCYCYLEDLFVDPAARGQGIAAALIEGVTEAARAAQAERLYWVTDAENRTAQKLYDRLATRSSFVQYRRPL
ncbi:GNAT family N-acetyltransferase [Phaeovulum sp. W22_SRMD_FR3]|uniref:GNAT family N-acetyltransferase n=1 Tax=Phaeovulum sp. W22_SRMD_FR3 TaxID=3240274 RepID=UPI003F99E8C5